MIIIVPEATISELITPADALNAIEAVFSAMDKGDARNFPVVREPLAYRDALYGFKSGFDRAHGVLGVKSGGYWPENKERGLENHQSSVLLFDQNSGKLTAVVGGNYLTALRTVAAAAVSAKHLSRKNCTVLGILDAGGQSPHQLRAICAVRPIKRIIAWNRTPERVHHLVQAVKDLDIEVESRPLDEVVAQADILVTITSSFRALFDSSLVRLGTHICAMGTDTTGKQELDPSLFLRAKVYTDEPAQAQAIGECQHAIAQLLLSAEEIYPLGAVINGRAIGRTSDDDITVFDSTGVGLQDLAMAARVVEVARNQNRAICIDDNAVR